jgi:hypothetical protein
LEEELIYEDMQRIVTFSMEVFCENKGMDIRVSLVEEGCSGKRYLYVVWGRVNRDWFDFYEPSKMTKDSEIALVVFC